MLGYSFLFILGCLFAFLAFKAVKALLRSYAKSRKMAGALRQSEEKFRAVAETAHDAIISANQRGEIVYLNKAAELLFGYASNEVVGRPLPVLMPARFHEAHKKGLQRYLTTGEAHVIGRTVELAGRKKEGSEFPLELSLATWKTNQEIYFIAILRDITLRKRLEAEKEKLINELKEALANVKTLGGLLPICASCKKIRDDKGYWEHVETYVRDRSAAEFTHGICPDCAKQMYPKIFPETPER